MAIIILPADGSQPEPSLAAQYACANVDNDPYSPITEWYMRMFGWVGDNEDQIAAGFDSSGNPCPIIVFDESMRQYENDFWDCFGKIAANPVGRILLYSLLLEIHRLNGSRELCYADGTHDRAHITCLRLHIRNGESFRYERGAIRYTQAATYNWELLPNDDIILARKDSFIALFHELLHFLHDLQYNDYENKSTDYKQRFIRAYYPIQSSYTIYPADYFRGWESPVNKLPDFEELYTIGGIDTDISENAFRLCENLHLRIFHTGTKDPSVGVTPLAVIYPLAAILRSNALRCLQSHCIACLH